jgi:hypothetical protein
VSARFPQVDSKLNLPTREGRDADASRLPDAAPHVAIRRGALPP